MARTDVSSWPTREETAELLARSVPTVDRLIRAGTIKTAERPREGKKPAVVCNPADVERLRPEAPAAPAFVERKGAGPFQNGSVTALPAAVDGGGPFATQSAVFGRLLELFTQVRINADRGAQPVEFLSVKDSAGLTGLSVAYIQRLVKEGLLPHVRDGRSVKIRRHDLGRL